MLPLVSECLENIKFNIGSKTFLELIFVSWETSLECTFKMSYSLPEPRAKIKGRGERESEVDCEQWLEQIGVRQQPCWFASRFSSSHLLLCSTTIMLIMTGPLDWARKTSRRVRNAAETSALSSVHNNSIHRGGFKLQC